MPTYYFDDILFDPELVAAEVGQRFPITGSPTLANSVIFNPTSGIAKTAVWRADAIRMITMKIALATVQNSDYFQNFWLGGEGSAYGFRFRYQPDYKAELEAFATSNGVLTTFNLYKIYKRAGAAHQYQRRICKPVVTAAQETNSFQLLAPNGVDNRVIETTFRLYRNAVEIASGWTVNAKTGVVTFAVAPAAGTLAWTGEYDTPVCFVGNSYEHNFDVPSEITGVQLREILPPEIGIAY